MKFILSKKGISVKPFKINIFISNDGELITDKIIEQGILDRYNLLVGTNKEIEWFIHSSLDKKFRTILTKVVKKYKINSTHFFCFRNDKKIKTRRYNV